MDIPQDNRYTREHEWFSSTEEGIHVGITAYAQEELGDVVFVDLPEIGSQVSQGDSVASVESVKAVSDIYAPLSGTVAAVNERLADAPELLNESPFEEGWIVVLKPDTAAISDEGMSAEEYSAYLEKIAK